MCQKLYRLGLPHEGNDNSRGNTANPTNQKIAFFISYSPDRHMSITGKLRGMPPRRLPLQPSR